MSRTSEACRIVFLDPRHTDMHSFTPFQNSTVTLPRTGASLSPAVIVPPHSTVLYAIATSSGPTLPIDMQLGNGQGGNPFGFTGSPLYSSTNSFANGQYQSVISQTQQEMPQGILV